MANSAYNIAEMLDGQCAMNQRASDEECIDAMETNQIAQELDLS